MQAAQSHASNSISAAVQSAYPTTGITTPTLFTVEQFSVKQPAFTKAALRNMIFKAESRQGSKGEIPGNGLIEFGAIIRVGRKVLIDETRFLEWVRTQSTKG